jgi:hypothetical protein
MSFHIRTRGFKLPIKIKIKRPTKPRGEPELVQPEDDGSRSGRS